MKRIRDIFFALLVSTLTALLISSRQVPTIDGLSHDLLFWLRTTFLPTEKNPAASPTVVIAIDEETYRREPFRDTPRVMWTKAIGEVIDAVIQGGALVVGFDVIFPTTVAGKIRGFDREYLRTLRRYGDDGRIVLGMVQHQLKPIVPFAGQRFAVGHSKNIRATNLFTDDDGIIRRVPRSFRVSRGDGAEIEEHSLSAELAKRAGIALWGDGINARKPLGSMLWSDDKNLAVNFEGLQGLIPTFAFADLHACTVAGDTDYFRRHFEGRVVLLGAVLDTEDRKLTSMRFATAPDVVAFADRCQLKPMPGLLSENIVRDTIPGVYVHAFAVNNILQGDALLEPKPVVAFVVVLALLFTLSLTALKLSAWQGGVVWLVSIVAWTALSIVIFSIGSVLPWLQASIGSAACFAGMSTYRFAVADRERRHMRNLFGYYLAPSIIDRMVENRESPRLGGETREVTVWFSDLVGFTSASENQAPEKIVVTLNCYLSAMTDIVEEHSGFVDKYIGDAILAVFGAPHEDPSHALHGVEAALACEQRLTALNAELGLTGSRALRHRIGINSGKALVGNIGSRRRFNYTVMGDAVNLAARIEGVNKLYGTHVLVSGETVKRCGNGLSFREIDRVRVLGRTEPVVLFELISDTTGGPMTEPQLRMDFMDSMTAFRAGNYAIALEGLEGLASVDPVAAKVAERCRCLIDNPPPEDWDGVRNLDQK